MRLNKTLESTDFSNKGFVGPPSGIETLNLAPDSTAASGYGATSYAIKTIMPFPLLQLLQSGQSVLAIPCSCYRSTIETVQGQRLGRLLFLRSC